jgi:hypothetical protein
MGSSMPVASFITLLKVTLDNIVTAMTLDHNVATMTLDTIVVFDAII